MGWGVIAAPRLAYVTGDTATLLNLFWKIYASFLLPVYVAERAPGARPRRTAGKHWQAPVRRGGSGPLAGPSGRAMKESGQVSARPGRCVRPGAGKPCARLADPPG